MAQYWKMLVRKFDSFASSKAEGIRKKVFRIIKHRHAFIMNSAEVAELSLPDLLDLVRLYRASAKADFAIRAIWTWGQSQSKEQFAENFRQYFFHAIAWDRLSSQALLELRNVT